MTNQIKSNSGKNSFNNSVSVSAEAKSNIPESINCLRYNLPENSALSIFLLILFIKSEVFMQFTEIKITVNINKIFPGKNTSKQYSNPLSIYVFIRKAIIEEIPAILKKYKQRIGILPYNDVPETNDKNNNIKCPDMNVKNILKYELSMLDEICCKK